MKLCGQDSKQKLKCEEILRDLIELLLFSFSCIGLMCTTLMSITHLLAMTFCQKLEWFLDFRVMQFINDINLLLVSNHME